MKRFTATEKWQKDWFQSLTPGQKCLWNYLCDNCDAAGVWEPNWRLASFVINETFTAESLTAFGDRVCTLPDGKIWLTGFCEFQYSQLSRDCRAHTHILRILEKHGVLSLVEHLIAGTPDNLSDTLWYRVPDRDKEKDKDKDKEQDRNQDPARLGQKITQPGFARSAAAAATATAAAAVGTIGAVLDPDLSPVAAAVRASRPGPRTFAGPRPGKTTLSAVAAAAAAPEAAALARGTPMRAELAALGQRIGAIMRRRPGSRWSEREQAALAALFPLAEVDMVLIERYYAAEVPPPDDIRRRDLLTLLNHWPGELDRARAYWRKRGWRQPDGEDTSQGGVPAGLGTSPLPEGFAQWKAQAPEYAGTEWRDWPAVPSFAREEFHRWKRQKPVEQE